MIEKAKMTEKGIGKAEIPEEAKDEEANGKKRGLGKKGGMKEIKLEMNTIIGTLIGGKLETKALKEMSIGGLIEMTTMMIGGEITEASKIVIMRRDPKMIGGLKTREDTQNLKDKGTSQNLEVTKQRILLPKVRNLKIKKSR